MQQRSENYPYRSIETDTTSETAIRVALSHALDLRLHSSRCREAQSQDLVNQDYAQVEIRDDSSALYFCVCDGVGSSFRGDFAARYLSHALVDWLQRATFSDWSSAAVAADLRTQLRAWTKDAQAQLAQLSAPPGTPQLVREVLEELRQSAGSSTVFMGGRLIFAPAISAQDKANVAELFFCWSGNITARLFYTPERSRVFGGTARPVCYWSTAHGLQGSLDTRHFGPMLLQRLIISTDGLQTIEPHLPELDEENLRLSMSQLLLRPENDDMTMLDLQWYDRTILEREGGQ